MAKKVYEEKLIGGSTVGCSGRYWHMKNEHAVLEDYAPLSPPGDESTDTPE
jgi:hypothetical protein